MGWGFRAVTVMVVLVEALVRFFGKKEGNIGICFLLLRVGFSSVMVQGGLSGFSALESSLRI
jgi:hypothetical protein